MERTERMRRMHERGLTYEEIGQIEGISKQRVGRILKAQKANAEPPIWLSISAAAAYLGVHPNTLRRWANEGRIECVHLANVRRDRRFARQELDKFLKPEG